MIESLAEAMRAAPTVTVLTGSGLSADSGVPTFRDAQTGLWAHYRPEDLATPEAFERDPDTVWKWYASRRKMLREVEPNAGHAALAALERRLADLRLVTQNVDGLHQRAGHERVIEFHGNLGANVCHREQRAVDIDVGDDAASPPACPHCGGPIRPGVAWFGEAIPREALEQALAAADACDVFVAVGTSAQVHPAAGLADMARAAGARIAEINPAATAMSSDVDLRIAESATSALPRLVEMLGD